MPGMAEPDIALDIVSAAPSMTPGDDVAGHRFAPRPRLALRALGLIGADAGVAALAAMLSYAVFDRHQNLSDGTVLVPIACLTICTILNFAERGLYASYAVISRAVPWRKLVLAWLQSVAVGTLAVFCIASLAGAAGLPPALERMGGTLRGPWVPIYLALGLAGLALMRVLRQRVHDGLSPLNRTVIIGEGATLQDLVGRIGKGTQRNFDLIGHVPPAGTEHTPTTAQTVDLPSLGDLDSLERMIRQDAVDTVLVAMPWTEAERIRAIIARISMAPVDVYIYPGLTALNLPLMRRTERALDNLPLLMACHRPIDGWRGFVKRAEDIVLSAGLLLFISPVMLTIAAAVKATSKGPVFFRQRRLGYNNRVIEVLKFRSMYTHLSDANAVQQSFRGDKRVTRIGAWLRKTSLDELPQLLNVLKGDMSLVGPRPHALATTAGGMALEEAVPVYASRHRVRPGITGWAQIHGYRGALDSVDKIVHRVNHDLYYIENWSLMLDLKILWRTVKLVFADDNAF